MPEKRPTITFVGTTPPPFTGSTIMTGVIMDALKKSGPVRCFNWSPRKPIKGLKWKCYRVWAFVKTILGLIFRGPRRGEVLYFPANSNWGLGYNITFLSIAKLFGYRAVMHHHSYAYIDSYDPKMNLLVKLVGNKGAHVVHCELMRDDFLSKYSTDATFFFLSPAIVSNELPGIDPTTMPSRSKKDRFYLGFLSNITLAKGIDLILKTFERVVEEGHDVGLILAGPCFDAEAKRLVDDALAKWPDRVTYLGPVFGDEKAAFYSKIDAFIFPTKSESWGIVLSEAMSFGCPAIAFGRGSIPWIFQEGSGLVVDPNDDFVQLASSKLTEWMTNPESYKKARIKAFERNEHLELEAQEQLTDFVKKLPSF